MAWPFGGKKEDTPSTPPGQEWTTESTDQYLLSIAWVNNKCSTWICSKGTEQQHEKSLSKVDPGVNVTHRYVGSPEEARKLAEGLGC